MANTATSTSKKCNSNGNNNNTTNNKPNSKKNNNPKKQQSAKKKKQQSGTSTTYNKSQHPKQQQQQSPPIPKPKPKLAVDPPLECVKADFEALLGDAAGLANYEEASTELLDCARYGEVDACRAILDVWSNNNNSSNNNNTENDSEATTNNNSSDDNDSNNNTTQNDATTIVNSNDTSKSTPLHKACANGHASTVQLLLSRGALHTANDSGNTPLHWAAGAGHEKCVKLLLDHFDALYLKETDGSTTTTANTNNANRSSSSSNNNSSNVKSAMDVLLKNAYGRSALTEGFASGHTKTVEHLLNHDSAEEEKLIGGLGKKDVEDEREAEDVATGVDGNDDADDGEKKKKTTTKTEKVEKKGIVHEFDFSRGNGEEEVGGGDGEGSSVLIRELPITHADNPFGQAPIEDTTGLGIWCASLVMARWLASPPMVRRMEGKTVLELGAGCGIPALACAAYSNPKSVTITDLNPETIDNIRYNIELNERRQQRDDDGGGEDDATTATKTTTVTTASSIDWGDEATYPSNTLDYVICSDCIYQKDIVPLLKKVVTGLLHPDRGMFLYVAPEGGRDGLPEFIAAMKAEGFECAREEIAPDAYRENPLRSGDEEDCFLHFHELASTVYVLYEFRRVSR